MWLNNKFACAGSWPAWSLASALADQRSGVMGVMGAGRIISLPVFCSTVRRLCSLQYKLYIISLQVPSSVDHLSFFAGKKKRGETLAILSHQIIASFDPCSSSNGYEPLKRLRWNYGTNYESGVLLQFNDIDILRKWSSKTTCLEK